MKLTCFRCCKEFQVTSAHLGAKVCCPHCRQVVELPSAETPPTDGKDYRGERGSWLRSGISGLVSCLVHMILLIIFALTTLDYFEGEGVGEEVLIGGLPGEQLSVNRDDELDPADTDPSSKDESELDNFFDEVAPTDVSGDEGGFEVQLGGITPSGAGGGSGMGGIGRSPGSIGPNASFGDLMKHVRRHGLDVVLTFDSTGSMSGEINTVKQRILQIGRTLLTKAPKTRIGICTYRDRGDTYVVQGTPLTSDLETIYRYLNSISAGGGGDHPESVHRGLEWSLENNDFRRKARNVILLFGDAPPHRQDLATCLRLAGEFHQKHQGLVSTITCRSSAKLPEFVEIAEAGGGESFLIHDHRRIMEELVVLIFGAKHRAEVMRFFELQEIPAGGAPPRRVPRRTRR